MAVVRDILEAIHQRRGGANSGSDLFSTIDPYARTAGEVAAGIVPVNFSYPPLYVDRYATNTVPGTTSMVGGFNMACKVAKYASGVVRYGATGLYMLDGPVDCTTAPGQLPSGLGFTIRNEGSPLAITTNQPNTGSIIARHAGHVFDCTGTNGLIFENVSISSDVTTYPKTGWFLARNTDGASQTIHLKDCRYYGKASAAIVYNYGSENYLQFACTFIQVAADVGSKTCYYTSHNPLSLTSTFTTVATGTQSTTVINIRDGECQHQLGSTTSDILYFDAVGKALIEGTFLDSAPPSASIRAHVYVDTARGPTNIFCMRGVTSEAQTHQPLYGLYIGDGLQTCSYFTLDGCDLSGSTSKIFAAANITCDDFHIRSISSDNSLGNINITLLQNSVIEEMATAVVIGTSTNNVLIVPSNNLTVTTRNADSWIDTGVHTWTPGTGAITHGGVLTVSNKRVEYHGQQVTVTMVMSDTVSLAIGAGGAITGLPIAPTVGAANVIVANGSTNAVIGVGQVSGTSLILPAISVGAGVNVGITATYFCS